LTKEQFEVYWDLDNPTGVSQGVIIIILFFSFSMSPKKVPKKWQKRFKIISKWSNNPTGVSQGAG
jgi:hypothetical protein